MTSFQSFSVPTSPAMTRSSKVHPVTPQRLPRYQHRHSQSAYKSPNTPSTPYTPLSLRSSSDCTDSSTLTTPDHVSTLVKKRLTFARSPEVQHNCLDVSEEKDQSLADLAANWRTRANENGIKVSSHRLHDDSHFGDDEASDMTTSDIANDSGMTSTEEALLPPPFMSYHRKSLSHAIASRPRALSHASLPVTRNPPFSRVGSQNANCTMPLSSPAHSRRTLSSLNQSSNIMSTPPPNRNLTTQLKLKGSLTDPAHTRRREAFGVIPVPSKNIGRGNTSLNLSLSHDTSLDLFDINENDFENEHEHDQKNTEFQDESFSVNLQAHTANMFGYTAPSQQDRYQMFPTANHFADPFYSIESDSGIGNHILNSISESVEHHFHSAQHQQALPPSNFFSVGGSLVPHHYGQELAQPYAKPAYAPLPQNLMPSMSIQSIPAAAPVAIPIRNFVPSPASTTDSDTASTASVPKPTGTPTDCSVCFVSHPSSLAILQPCAHPLCSGCLTSALNIVGEKDMQCAVCKKPVADFKLVAVNKYLGKIHSTKSNQMFQDEESHLRSCSKVEEPCIGRSFMDLLSSSPGNSTGLGNGKMSPTSELEGAFEFGLGLDELRASTPKLEQQPIQDRKEHVAQYSTRRGAQKGDSNVVLRIDNVPWDITPNQVIKWLQQPVERVHVLLDGKGKTLSHTYVEVKDSVIAGAILRGEAMLPNGIGKKERGSVLGKGRRARGVTVTRSGHEELMANLFPSWQGTFEGSRPSLASLEGDSIIVALDAGLLTEGEICGLLRLIQEPDSHFLKVPVLPFYSLLSLLSKFPSDTDSRVFWSARIRDLLYDTTYAAIQVLLPRIEAVSQHSSLNNQNEEYTTSLVINIVQVAVGCQAFTAEQVRGIVRLLEATSISLPSSLNSSIHPDSRSGHRSPSKSSANIPRSPLNSDLNLFEHIPDVIDNAPFDDLAREFGVESQLVQALAQRLASLS